MGRSRKSRVVALLGASGVLATVLSGTGSAAQAQPVTSQRIPSPVIHSRTWPCPAPCRTALAASSWTARTTFLTRLSGIPASDT
jgi:hypothetical protein